MLSGLVPSRLFLSPNCPPASSLSVRLSYVDSVPADVLDLCRPPPPIDQRFCSLLIRVFAAIDRRSSLYSFDYRPPPPSIIACILLIRNSSIFSVLMFASSTPPPALSHVTRRLRMLLVHRLRFRSHLLPHRLVTTRKTPCTRVNRIDQWCLRPYPTEPLLRSELLGHWY